MKKLDINPIDYLHHRAPYLMVDNVIELTENSIQTQKMITKDLFFIEGHFPGAPIVPGAMMQEMCTQSAGILIAKNFNPMSEFNTHDPFFNKYALGVLRSVQKAKYSGLVKLSDSLIIKVQLLENLKSLFNFRGQIFSEKENKKIASLEFQLCNIESKLLYS